MSERIRRAQRGRLAFAPASLLALSGCTVELWSGYAWPDPVVTEELLDRRTQVVIGTLVASPRVLENGLWWCEDGEPTGHWWLCPKAGAVAGAEFAAALLADPDFCVVQSATIDAVRRHAVGEVVGNEAVLELDLQLQEEAIGRTVPATDVSPAAARVLARMQRNAYMPIADAHGRLPTLYQRCAERLANVDLRRLTGEPFPVYADAWVFVDADDRPAFCGGADGVALPPAADDEGAPLADRLTALQELSLLVRARSGSASTILRLRPDRVWLLSGLQVDGDRCVHRSTWYLQQSPLALAAPAATGAPRMLSTLRLQEEHYQRSYHPVLVDGEALAKVALTPVTLALDLVLGPGLPDFVRWITGKRPKPEYRGPERSY